MDEGARTHLCVCVCPRVCARDVHTCVFVAYYAAAVNEPPLPPPKLPHLDPLPPAIDGSTGCALRAAASDYLSVRSSSCGTGKSRLRREEAAEVFQVLCKTNRGGRNGMRKKKQKTLASAGSDILAIPEKQKPKKQNVDSLRGLGVKSHREETHRRRRVQNVAPWSQIGWGWGGVGVRSQ